VRFHLGTLETGARIVTIGGALAPGMRKQARITLDEPVVARAGDRFVLRSASPLVTIGGGIIGDPAPQHRRARPWTSPAITPAERLAHALTAAGAHGVEIATLATRLGATPDAVGALLAAPDVGSRRIGGRIFTEQVISAHAARFMALVEEHHARSPLDPGAPLQSIRARLGSEPALADLVLDELVRAGQLEVSGALVMRHGWSPVLTPAQRAAREALFEALATAGREPPSVGELEARFGPATLSLLRMLEREGSLVQVEGDRFYASPVVEELTGALKAGMAPGREYGPAELRDLLGFSRKYLIPFLEYCDRVGVTERRSGGRTLGAR
jgi:selenocysteine-specific elongation factor